MGVVVAVVAALAYALAFLPPIGHLRIGLTEDVFVLATFVVVAVLVAFISDASPDAIVDPPARRPAGRPAAWRVPRSAQPAHHDQVGLDDLLDGPDYDAATRAELLNMVVDESDRLDRIVGNLLSVSRIEAGAPRPRTFAVRHRRDRRDVCLAGSSDSEGTPPVSKSSSSRTSPRWTSTRVQVDQVLTNLVENAPPGPPPESRSRCGRGDTATPSSASPSTTTDRASIRSIKVTCSTVPVDDWFVGARAGGVQGHRRGARRDDHRRPVERRRRCRDLHAPDVNRSVVREVTAPRA